MSAFPLKADMCTALADVRYGPIADIAGHNRLLSLVGPFTGAFGGAFVGALGAASILGVIDFAMWCRRRLRRLIS
jgi:hypothetical protein